jgi:hypothetical protein
MAHSLQHTASASIDWKKATSSGNLATQDQSGKGVTLEFVSSDPNTAGGQATIEFAMKYSYIENSHWHWINIWRGSFTPKDF